MKDHVEIGHLARFSKVPKLFGAFSGLTIPFLSQERGNLNRQTSQTYFF